MVSFLSEMVMTLWHILISYTPTQQGWDRLLPDSSVHGGVWQWNPSCGAGELSFECCCRYCRISWRSSQPVHSGYKPGNCPARINKHGSGTDDMRANGNFNHEPEKVGKSRRVTMKEEQEWLWGWGEKRHYLEFGGDENIMLLQFFNCLVFGGNSTFNRVLQCSTLELLHLNEESK